MSEIATLYDLDGAELNAAVDDFQKQWKRTILSFKMNVILLEKHKETAIEKRRTEKSVGQAEIDAIDANIKVTKQQIQDFKELVRIAETFRVEVK